MQGRVCPGGVGHEEYDPLFARRDAVHGVQESRKLHGRLILYLHYPVSDTTSTQERGQVPHPHPSSLICARLLKTLSTFSMRMKLLSGAFDIK